MTSLLYEKHHSPLLKNIHLRNLHDYQTIRTLYLLKIMPM
jgi:hypothetical protein